MSRTLSVTLAAGDGLRLLYQGKYETRAGPGRWQPVAAAWQPGSGSYCRRISGRGEPRTAGVDVAVADGVVVGAARAVTVAVALGVAVTVQQCVG